MMNESKAFNFYQPEMRSAQLIAVIDFCSKLADKETNFPELLWSGESSSPTAAATSMLTSSAAKGAMAVVGNVNAGIIIPSVDATHQYILQYDESGREFFGDFRIDVRGTSAASVKEQSALRIKEMLQVSANQIDQPVITPDIRMRLYKELADKIGIDPEIFGDAQEIEDKAEEIAQLQMMRQAHEMMMMEAVGPGDGSSGTMREAPAPMMTSPGVGMQQGGQDNPMFSSQPGSSPG